MNKNIRKIWIIWKIMMIRIEDIVWIKIVVKIE